MWSLNFLAKNFELFKINVGNLKLIEKATYLDKDVQFLQFYLLKNNIIVADSSVSFRFKKKKLVQIINYSFSEAELSKKEEIKIKLNRIQFKLRDLTKL